MGKFLQLRQLTSGHVYLFHCSGLFRWHRLTNQKSIEFTIEIMDFVIFRLMDKKQQLNTNLLQ